MIKQGKHFERQPHKTCWNSLNAPWDEWNVLSTLNISICFSVVLYLTWLCSCVFMGTKSISHMVLKTKLMHKYSCRWQQRHLRWVWDVPWRAESVGFHTKQSKATCFPSTRTYWFWIKWKPWGLFGLHITWSHSFSWRHSWYVIL